MQRKADKFCVRNTSLCIYGQKLLNFVLSVYSKVYAKMPLPKKCGICGKNFLNLSSHLSKKHKTSNTEEHKLLLQYGSGRVSGKLSCPICDKRLTRIDKHLIDVHKLNSEEIDDRVKTAKLQKIVKRLKELRQKKTALPLKSTLDLDEADSEAIGPLNVDDLIDEGDCLNIVKVSGGKLRYLSFLND